MNLVKKLTTAKKMKKAGSLKNAASENIKKSAVSDMYLCPGHPEITSSTPGKCPKEGNLLKKQ